MLREEELNISSDSDTRPASRPSREKDFSFIQNRVPSPLHNNFLLSEEQSRHMRQPSDNFTLPHNLMTQDEFKNPSFSSFQSNNQQSLIVMMMHQNKIDERDEENEGSSNGEDDEEDGTPQVEFQTSQMSIFTADQPSQLHHYQQNNNNNQMMQNQILVTESNNDDFNYSESNYQFAGSSSIGAILQNNNGGSFVNNYQQNQVLAFNYNPPLLSGRQSATPLNYDNSLMNLSYTPASQNIASSQLVVQNNRQVQDEEVSQGQIEEQDQSMIKTQDVWFNSKKNNPLEMPLQMNDQLFSRAKLTEESFLFQQQVEQQEQIQREISDLESQSEVGDSEIKMIKKKLDFSRLSLLQNASQQQLNNQQFPNSFLFQTYQSQLSNNVNNHSLSHNDTQHYSTCGAIDIPLSQIAIPFEQLLTDRAPKSRNSGTYNTISTTNNNNKLNKTKDEGVQVEHDRFSCGTVSKESSITPPLSKAKTSLNSTRPPLLKQITPSQYKEGQEQTQQEISVFPKKITVSNGNQPIQQNGPNGHPLLQHYQVPTQTRSTSSTNFIDSKKSSQRPKNKLTLNICQPDTPGEPSQSLIIDPHSNENVVSTTNNQRKIVKLLTNQMMHSLDDTVNELQQLNDKIKVMASSKESGKSKQVKLKKKQLQKPTNENQLKHQGESNRQSQVQQQQISSRAGDTSRQRRQDSNNGKKQPSVMGFMSKTMIISKDKILPAKAFDGQQSKQQQIIENIIQSNHQIQKYKLQKVKKAKVVPVVSSQNPLLNHPPPMSSGRSLPNSNLSSAQTSFLTTTTQNIKKIAPQQKTTTKKIVEDKMNKLKKKNNSIVRQHIMNGTGNQTQKVKDIVVESQHHQHKQISKCNTQRSVSRPKSGYRNENNLEITGAGNNQSLKKFGRKKHSQQIFTSTTESVNANKENIRPTSSTQGLKPQKKSFQMVGAPLNRPEQMLQSYENIKLVNAQELLKEIYVQQQKLSSKNFQNLFSTMDGNVDISKRVKTEEASSYHLKNATSNIVLDQEYLDAYPIQQTQVSQSVDTQRLLMLQKLNQNEIYENLYKAGGISSSHQNINNNTQNFMQRMQSPYNSKSMKNKFNSNKNRKAGDAVQMAQIKPMTNCQSEQQMNECKRCDELLFLLNNTRFVGR